MPRYERDGDLWQIVQTGAQLEIAAGGKTTTRKFVTAAQAKAQLEKLVAERVAEGYAEQRDPRHAELEAAIAADPESAAAYAIYGDWLESLGDPRGRLIALQIAAEAKGADPKLRQTAQKLLAEHSDTFLGPLAAHAVPPERGEAAFVWRFGFIHRAHLHADRQAPIHKTLEQLLQHPSGRFLTALALVEFKDPDAQAAVDVLDRLAPASLRALRITRDVTIDLAETWQHVPALRRLALEGRALAIGQLELPQLEQLDLADQIMAHATLRAIARADWPVLQHLRIDFGRSGEGSASIDDLFALLARRDLPALVQLSIIRARYPRELVDELVASPLAAQLVSLCLSDASLEDRHVKVLADNAARFPRLRHLDVSRNYQLHADGVEALRSTSWKIYSAG